MASSGGFSITIKAVDQATATLDNLNRRLRGLQAPVENLQRSLARFGQLTGLTKLWQGFNSAVNSALGGLMRMVPAIGAITAGGVIAGLAGLVRTWTEYGQQLVTTSNYLGLMPTQLQTLQNAMGLVGGSATETARAYQSLDDTMQDAVAGRNVDALRIFNALGINIRKAGLEAKTAADIMPQLFNKIQELGNSGRLNPAMQRRLAGMFGLTPEMMRVAIREGAAGLARLQQEAAKHGLNDDEINKLDAFRTKTESLSQSFQAFGARLAIALQPLLSPMMERLEAWMSNPANINSTKEALINAVKGAQEFFEKVDSIAQGLGGWKRVIEAIIGLKFLGFVAGLITPLTNLAAAITSASTATAALNSNMTILSRNPGMRTLGLLLQLYDKIKNPIPFNADNTSPDSPFFKDLPPEEQERSRKLHNAPTEGGEAPTMNAPIQEWWRHYAPTWLGGRPAAAPGGGGGGGGPIQPSTPFEGTQGEYYNQRYQELLKAGRDRGVENPEVVARLGAAQSSLETGYGRHSVGNNMYGIKAGPGDASVEAGADEVVNGQRVRTSTRFAAYNNPAESSKGYIDYLMRNRRYQGVLHAKTDQEAISEVGRSGYATDPNYAAALRKIESQAAASAPAVAAGQPVVVNPPRQGAQVDGKITVDVNSAVPNTTATTKGDILGVPKVVSPMTGYASPSFV